MAIKIRKRDNERDPESDAPEQTGDPANSDAFVEATVRSASWIEENRKLVFGAVIALIVAAIGIWVAVGYVDSQKIEASSELSPALWAYSVPVEGSPETEAIRENADIDLPEKVYASDSERWQAVYDEASSAMESQSSEEVTQAARLSKAAAAAQLDKTDEARELYSAYLDGDTDPSMIPFAYLGLAGAQAAEGDAEAAAETLDKLAQQGEDYEAMALYQKGQVLEGSGSEQEAKEIYQELLESHPQNPYRDDIERRLALL